jgi:drug/metabolite transporter (DMT)-like permease
MRTSTLAWIWIAQGIGGSTPALTKLALAGIGPFGVVVARQILGALFLLALARFGAGARGGAPTSPEPPWSRRDWVLLLTLSWAGFALPQILGAVGLRLSSATHGALLSPLEPIGILLGAALVLREPLGGAHAIAAALGIAGTVLIVWPAGAQAPGGNLRGDLVMAAGHLCWAIYTLAAKPLVERHDPLRIAIRAGLLSVIPLAPLLALESFEPEGALASLGWVLLLAFASSGLGTVAWNRALREVRAATMALFVFVQPLVGLAIGALALGEPAGGLAILGAALIVVGAAAATWASERGAPAPEVAA